MQLGIIQQTPPETVAAVPAALADVVSTTPHCRFERAHFHNIGGSALEIELVFYVDVPEFAVMMDARQAVSLGILRRFADMGVRLATPVQTGFTAGPDGNLIDPRTLLPAGTAS
jgi:small-conductance mechanosensitive channel